MPRGYLYKFNKRITKRRGEVGRGQVDSYVHIGSTNLKFRALYTMNGITGKNSKIILVCNRRDVS